MKYPQKRWFWPWYFPDIVEASFEVVLYILHCPPMLFNVPLIVCTSLLLILLFRLCKLHPDVRTFFSFFHLEGEACLLLGSLDSI